MAFTYGFYNSQDGDRVYDADQFSSFLDGIVYDGVYEAVGDKFYVTSLEDENLTIQVGAGRAWLKHTWSLNDTNLYLTATAALDVYDRIDAVVLEVNKTNRENVIKIVEGNPSDSNPQRPDLTNEDNVRQYPLAYIYREHGTTIIPDTHAGTSESVFESAAECIKFMVGSSAMPLCSALALTGIPSGGLIGQVLAKSSSESGSVGWYDVDKLPYDRWYLADSITENDVIAAYRFSGRLTQADALKNVNEGTIYTLTLLNTTWSSDMGFYIKNPGGGAVASTSRPKGSGLVNSDLMTTAASSAISMVAYFTDVQTTTSNPACLICLKKSKMLFAKVPIITYNSLKCYKAPGYIGASGTNEKIPYYTPTAVASGFAGVDYSTNTMYVNGNSSSKTAGSSIWNSMHFAGRDVIFGNPGPGNDYDGTYKDDLGNETSYTGYYQSASPYYLRAVALYSKTVSGTDMYKIYNSMKQL